MILLGDPKLQFSTPSVFFSILHSLATSPLPQRSRAIGLSLAPVCIAADHITFITTKATKKSFGQVIRNSADIGAPVAFSFPLYRNIRWSWIRRIDLLLPCVPSQNRNPTRQRGLWMMEKTTWLLLVMMTHVSRVPFLIKL